MLWLLGAGTEGRRLEYMREHGVAVVGWSGSGPVEAGTPEDQLARRLIASYPDADPEAVRQWSAQLRAFALGTTIGDQVAVAHPDATQLDVGTIVGPYRFVADAPPNRNHQVPVRWEATVPVSTVGDQVAAALDKGLTVAVLPDHLPLRTRRRMSRRAFLVGGTAAIAAVGTAGATVALTRDHTAASGSRSAAAPTRQTVGTEPATTTTTVAPVRNTPAGPVAQWVVDENAKPGSSGWNVGDPGPDGALEGYANTVSTLQGTPVTLYVSTVDPQFRVEAYRMGFYGGAGGRLVWTSETLPGKKQAPPEFDARTNTTSAAWEPSLTVPVDTNFPPGVYLLKLVGSSGVQQLVPLTVRDDNSTAAYLVQNSVTNWQAYNDWGGYSLYHGPDGAFASRARIVSFDRPYKPGAGQSDFLGLEFPLVMLMEQLGLDVTYTTDVDTHAHPELITKHAAFFSLGHDEYWSKQMRDGVEGARDAGTNLIFWGSNASFRQIRLEPSTLGPDRHLVCYKSASEDPITRTDPTLATVNWREPPVSRPESLMIGNLYESNPVRADMVIVDPGSWVFAGLGITPGQKLAGLVGSEYDHYLPSEQTPPGVQILAHSPLVCRGVRSYGDMTYYSASSGAGVLATGTLDWISALAPPGIGPSYNETVVAITKNILAGFGLPKVGAAHPSTPNYEAIAAQYGTASGLSGSPD